MYTWLKAKEHQYNSKQVHVGSRAAANTVVIERLSLVTTLACGRPLHRIVLYTSGLVFPFPGGEY